MHKTVKQRHGHDGRTKHALVGTDRIFLYLCLFSVDERGALINVCDARSSGQISPLVFVVIVFPPPFRSLRVNFVIRGSGGGVHLQVWHLKRSNEPVGVSEQEREC